MFLNGSVSYTSPRKRIPPKSTLTYTVAGVPAGNYSTWWACDSFAHGKTVVSVSGATSGKPYLADDSPAPTTPGGTSGLDAILEAFGS